jgi:oligopeptide transport system substrate-binding protein
MKHQGGLGRRARRRASSGPATTIDRVPGRRPPRLNPGRAIGAAALVVCLCLLAAACTSDGGDEGGQTAAGETARGSETTTESGPGETGAGGQGETAAEPEVPAGPTLRLAVGPGIKTLDPASAVDPAEGTILAALLDPLVQLDQSGEAVPALASSWDVSTDGRVVTFHLRPAGVWTNGDPVTASDFAYAWKRAASPRFTSRNAPLFFDIAGAEAYNRCDPETDDCAALRERIGVAALDDVTLEVTLKHAMPWFAQRVAHWAFLPVHEPTITRYKRRWSLPENMVSNGPFQLIAWSRGSSVTLERWDEWRVAGSVDLAVVEGSMTSERAAALVDFQDGRVDACLPAQCIPPRTERELAAAPEFAAYPAPVTTYLAIGTEAIEDVRVRRAVAIGLDRRAIVARSAPGVTTPATQLVPVGLPGFDSPDDASLQPRPQRGKARRLVRAAEASGPYVLAFSRGQRELAAQLQTQLGKIGLEVEIERRSPEQLAQADLYLASVAAQDAVAIEVLEHWTCDAGAFCDPAYDRLASETRRTVDPAEREALEHELEAALTGPKGAFPAAPLYWGTYGVLRGAGVEGLEPNALALVDLALVSMPGQ